MRKLIIGNLPGFLFGCLLTIPTVFFIKHSSIAAPVYPTIYVGDSISFGVPNSMPRYSYPGKFTQEIAEYVSWAPTVKCERVVILAGTVDRVDKKDMNGIRRDIRNLADICERKFNAPVIVVRPEDVELIARFHGPDGVHLWAEGYELLEAIYGYGDIF